MTRTVLIAPDSFGDSLTAVQAAQCIATGWRAARRDDRLILAPQSDGGPGFVDVLAGRLGEVRTQRVSGPLDAQVDARWVFDPTAPAHRLPRVRAGVRAGAARRAADRARPRSRRTPAASASSWTPPWPRVRAASSSDSAAAAAPTAARGMIDALGGLAAARERLAGIDLVAASDVEHPLLGPMGAAAVFGPQKGADPDTVDALEDRLTAWAQHLDAAAGRPVRDEPGAGAAGGLGRGPAGAGRPTGIRGGDHRRVHRSGGRPRRC